MTRFFRVALFLLLALATHAWALPITLHFTASNFASSNGNSAPTDPVTGTIVWDAPSLGAPIGALTSIDLILDGHTYSSSEVGFASAGTLSLIGGLFNGPEGVSIFTDDFSLAFDRVSATDIPVFFYASSQRSGIWDPAN